VPLLFNSAITAGFNITAAEQVLSRQLASLWSALSVQGRHGMPLPSFKSGSTWAPMRNGTYDPAFIIDAGANYGRLADRITEICPLWDEVGYLNA